MKRKVSFDQAELLGRFGRLVPVALSVGALSEILTLEYWRPVRLLRGNARCGKRNMSAYKTDSRLLCTSSGVFISFYSLWKSSTSPLSKHCQERYRNGQPEQIHPSLLTCPASERLTVEARITPHITSRYCRFTQSTND